MKIFLYYEEKRTVLDIHLKMFGSNVSHYLGELCIYPFGERFLLHCVVLICAGKEKREELIVKNMNRWIKSDARYSQPFKRSSEHCYNLMSISTCFFRERLDLGTN